MCTECYTNTARASSAWLQTTTDRMMEHIWKSKTAMVQLLFSFMVELPTLFFEVVPWQCLLACSCILQEILTANTAFSRNHSVQNVTCLHVINKAYVFLFLRNLDCKPGRGRSRKIRERGSLRFNYLLGFPRHKNTMKVHKLLIKISCISKWPKGSCRASKLRTTDLQGRQAIRLYHLSSPFCLVLGCFCYGHQ